VAEMIIMAIFGISLLMVFLAYKVIPKKLKGVEYNPLVSHTLSHVSDRNKCINTTCKTTTPPSSTYIGMSQAHCYQCGKKNRGMPSHGSEWVLPNYGN
jgi:hypothetical protein